MVSGPEKLLSYLAVMLRDKRIYEEQGTSATW